MRETNIKQTKHFSLFCCALALEETGRERERKHTQKPTKQNSRKCIAETEPETRTEKRNVVFFVDQNGENSPKMAKMKNYFKKKTLKNLCFKTHEKLFQLKINSVAYKFIEKK